MNPLIQAESFQKFPNHFGRWIAEDALPLKVEFGRFAHWTSDIGNIGAKLNIEKLVASVC